jgi:hypothetical protein
MALNSQIMLNSSIKATKQRTFRKKSLKKRPPNSNLHIWELFCESVDKALDSDLPLFLVGDYNCDMLSNSSNYFKKDIRSVKFGLIVLVGIHLLTVSSKIIRTL